MENQLRSCLSNTVLDKLVVDELNLRKEIQLAYEFDEYFALLLSYNAQQHTMHMLKSGNTIITKMLVI